jgi:hypothetical protein
MMNNLTPAGQNAVSDISQRYGISQDAVLHMLYAVNNGGGTMAQFNHPELGGGGQWMQGGMIMVGDMFNHNLQAFVSNLCNELSNLLANQQVLQPPPPGSRQQQNWYPSELGIPNSSGSQNNKRYAYFANSRRLAIEENGNVRVYNTLDHQIGGVSQQQSGGQSLSFSSQYGTVNLADLPLISVNGQAPQQAAPHSTSPSQQPPPSPTASPTQQDTPAPAATATPMAQSEVFRAIEQLGNLHSQGILSDEEFQQKKAELLGRL